MAEWGQGGIREGGGGETGEGVGGAVGGRGEGERGWSREAGEGGVVVVEVGRRTVGVCFQEVCRGILGVVIGVVVVLFGQGGGVLVGGSGVASSVVASSVVVWSTLLWVSLWYSSMVVVGSGMWVSPLVSGVLVRSLGSCSGVG